MPISSVAGRRGPQTEWLIVGVVLTKSAKARWVARMPSAATAEVPERVVPTMTRSLSRPLGREGTKEDDGWVGVAGEIGVAARTAQHGRGARTCSAETLNLFASFYVAFSTILTVDAVLGCALAVCYVLAYWTWAPDLAVNMSWNIVSLAVIFPISQGIGMGFKRREQALGEFGHMLGNMRAVWGAVHCWRLKNKDGEFIRAIESFEDPELAVGQVRALFEEFLTSLVTYFDVARWGRARHAVPCCGTLEQSELMDITHEQRLRVDHAIGRMQRLVQQLKTQGLPGGEAHRLDQYISKVGIAFERLCAIKEYRTPQAFRAFARVYILIIGALYGPYYLHVGKYGTALPTLTSTPTETAAAAVAEDEIGSLVFALVFACSIQLAMSGLFTIMLGLEDPFMRRGGRGQLDSINVADLVEVSRRQLLGLEADASEDWATRSEPMQRRGERGGSGGGGGAGGQA